MLAQAGARDVLLPTNSSAPTPALGQAGRVVSRIRFSTIADDAEAVGSLASAGQEAGITLPVLLDLDGGMGRTGIPLGQAAVTLYKLIDQLPVSNLPGYTCTTGTCTRVTPPSAWPSGKR